MWLKDLKTCALISLGFHSNVILWHLKLKDLKTRAFVPRFSLKFDSNLPQISSKKIWGKFETNLKENTGKNALFVVTFQKKSQQSNLE